VFGILYDLIDKICRLPQFTASLNHVTNIFVNHVKTKINSLKLRLRKKQNKHFKKPAAKRLLYI